MYGPANVDASRDAVVGSSIAGRLETGIGMFRLTTIVMPMKGERSLYIYGLNMQIYFGFYIIRVGTCTSKTSF